MLIGLIGLNTTGFEPVWVFLWISTLSSMIGYAMGMCIGCCFEDVRLAIEIAPLFCEPWALFAGFYSNLDVMPGWISWL